LKIKAGAIFPTRFAIFPTAGAILPSRHFVVSWQFAGTTLDYYQCWSRNMATTSNTGPTVDPNNFFNNAFFDFAPLLTLFGDEVTKQFLSTSLGMADNILIGIAPIGIITVIVSAIRVGGSRFMKSMIGRYVDSLSRQSPLLCVYR
jgi:hypothetical protein